MGWRKIRSSLASLPFARQRSRFGAPFPLALCAVGQWIRSNLSKPQARKSISRAASSKQSLYSCIAICMCRSDFFNWHYSIRGRSHVVFVVFRLDMIGKENVCSEIRNEAFHRCDRFLQFETISMYASSPRKAGTIPPP